MNENQIDRYLLNQMTPDEKEAFETELTKNDALANEVSRQREVIKDIEGIGRLELKSKLKEIHTELYSTETNTQKINERRLLSI